MTLLQNKMWCIIPSSQKKIRRNNLIMVSTRNSPQKKTRPTGVPTVSGQARVRAEHAEQRAKQQSAAAMRANAPPIEEARRPIEEEEVGDNNKEECVGSETMDDVDDDEEEQKVDDEEEEQGWGDVLGTVVLSRKSKLALKDTDLCTYVFNRLERMSCPN